MKSFEKREVYRFGLSVRLSVRPSVCTMGFWVLGLSDGAEIVQACSDGSLVVSAKFLGQGVVGFLFGGLWTGKKCSFIRNRGHSFCSKSTWKDSGVGQGW